MEVYDLAANSWSSGPAYPESTAWLSCGGIGGKLYCAGGATDSASTGDALLLDAATGIWSPIASLPVDLWASGSAAANGVLLVSGGVTAGTTLVTNQGYAYDPASNAWTKTVPPKFSGPHPPSQPQSCPGPLSRSGSSCALCTAPAARAGSTRSVATRVGSWCRRWPIPRCCPGSATAAAAADVGWLSESPTSLTLAAGGSATVTVTLDASVPEITQPGTLTASLCLVTARRTRWRQYPCR